VLPGSLASRTPTGRDALTVRVQIDTQNVHAIAAVTRPERHFREHSRWLTVARGFVRGRGGETVERAS
jgi:hypothetical protein